MTQAIKIETGIDFITLYFSTHNEMDVSRKKLYAFCTRFNKLHIELQRKYYNHKPGDIPHFHNGIEEWTPHFHIIFPKRPTKLEIEELHNILRSPVVGIDADNIKTKRIS